VEKAVEKRVNIMAASNMTVICLIAVAAVVVVVVVVVVASCVYLYRLELYVI
jgi:hypothetical protein